MSDLCAVGAREPMDDQAPTNDPEMPLAGPPPEEVPLREAPLVRVLAQLRFPVVASVEKREFIAPFQEAIRSHYPALRPETSRSFGLEGEGMRTTTLWRFRAADEHWQLTLAPDFLALDTTAYTSRDDFLERLELVLRALEEHVRPAVVDRFGLRYIDRVTGPALESLPDLLRTEVAGILRTPLAAHARHAIAENVFTLPDGSGQVTARWGMVPARATVDPGAVPPIDEPSWLLDLDAFQAETRAFDVAATVEQARGFAERIYSIFRWAVTDEFLRVYGAER